MKNFFTSLSTFYRRFAGLASASVLTLLVGQAQAQVAVDGLINTYEQGAGNSGYYTSMGQYTRVHSSTSGFGNFGLVQAYVSNTNTKLTIGLQGTLEPSTGNVFQVYLDLPNRAGIAAGTPLPGTFNGTTSFQGMRGTRMEMQTDYGLALGYNSTGSLTAQYADYTQNSSYAVEGNLGTVNSTGSASTFYTAAAQSRLYGTRMAYTAPSPNFVSSNTGEGWELELDMASLGVAPGEQVRVFVLYGSGNSGYVSTDFIPESNTTTNPGFMTNFGLYTGLQAYAYTLTGAVSSGSYCTSNLGGGSCSIYSVQLPGATTASTTSNCSGNSPNNYSAYSSGLTVQPGSGYSLSATTNVSGQSISAWADWNQDGQFGSNEYVQLSSYTTAYTPAMARINVPSGAALGSTRLRIRTRASTAPNSSTDACTRFGSGETRDYTITVGCNPVAPTVSGDGTFCVGQAVYLSASGIPSGASYYWTGPNGFTSYSSAPAFSATLASSGTYYLTVTSGTCSVTSRAVQVAVIAAPTVPVTTNSSNCGPGSVLLSASGAPSGGTYRWYNTSGSGAVLATGSTFTTPYLYSSAYYYVSTVSAAGCESSRIYALASINSIPTAYLNASGTTTFCQGGAVSLAASSSASGSFQFLRNGTAIIGATGTTYAATTSGNYTVTVTTATACASTSSPVTVTVNPGTSAAFAYASNTYCQSGVNPAPSVTGTAGGTFSANGNGLNLNPYNGTVNLAQSQPGTYTITYNVSGTCSSSSSTVLTISRAAQASFGYPATSYCASGSTVASVLVAGSSAGIFSASPNGLAINASTGEVNLAQSQPGTYTITNAIAAGSGCTPTSATAQLVVNPLPVSSLTASGPLTFCQGGSVILTAPSAPGNSFQFLRNGTAITGATGATYTATTAGNYTVTVTNATGCASTTATASAVLVNVATTATFAYNGNTFCQGGATIPIPVVSGTSGGSFSSTNGLSLNAGSGAIDLAQSQPGTYTVTYSVSGPCPSTGTASVTITAPSSASFAYAAPSFCAGVQGTAPITLASGASAGIFSALPTGLNLNATTGAIDLAQSKPGTYTITNSVASAGGCSATVATTLVIINATPTAIITAAGPTNFCQGGSVTLTASGGTGYQWSTGATTPSISVTASGAYTVTVTTAAGCSAIASAAVTVNPVPSAAFRYAASSYCTTGTNPVPTVTGTAGGSFSSTTGLSLNTTTGTIAVNTSTPGTYTVTYGVTGTCPSSAMASVTITSAPVATFSYANAAYCVSGTNPSAIVPATSTVGTFSSTPGLSLNATTGAILLASSTPGTYIVTNTIAASGGCAVTTATTSVTINAVPTATLTTTNPTTFCQGGTVILSAPATTGTTYQFQLNGVNISGATAATYSATTSGSYTVVATNTGGCIATSPATVVIVNSRPATPTLTAQYNGTTTTLTSSAPTGNQFYLNGTAIASATAQTYVVNSAAQIGAYSVVVTNANGCVSAPSVALTVTSSVKPLAGTSLTVYPNPTPDGNLRVELTGYRKSAELTVLNALGQVVFTSTVPASASATTQLVNLTQMATGIYILRVKTDGGLDTRRIVKE